MLKVMLHESSGNVVAVNRCHAGRSRCFGSRYFGSNNTRRTR
jgi:hypothetical protein